ncbi:site-specific integrase [Sphingomonas dokdonensis]|uniref:Phage integrase family protein n=1 Tax=Sphingomonas dokdonensis TaxID=344880 RepID=A0A245ZV92_9SPHN|nr:site-specific integrase [Sphingomonas dokdonensis]OWK33655.1 phage integrase family protein [Sphingomonas dokdonensis]
MGDETLARYPGLYARESGVWYVRKRVPVDLVGVEKRASLRFSLDTADLRTAIKRYPFKLAEIESHFDKLRERVRIMGPIAGALALGKLERLRHGQIEAVVSDWWRRREEARRPVSEEPEEIAAIVADVEHDARHVGAGADCMVVRSAADRLLVDAGIAVRPLRVGSITAKVPQPDVDRGSTSYRYLCELVARGLSAETALAKDHFLSRSDAPYDPIFNPDVSTGKQGSFVNDRRLADLFEAYTAERTALHGEQSTEKRYGFVFRIMAEVLGSDKSVSSLTRADCVKVLTFLKRLPPNASKRFPDLSLTEVAELADQQSLPRLAPNSIASYMQALAAVLRWAEDAGWGVAINMRDLTGSREATVKRRGFRPEELEGLFASLTPFRQAEPAKFWVPALALFTGARAGELCQLRVEDVEEVEGVKCLNLSLFDKTGRRVEDKRLKTKASERYVPLHPALLDAGFETFVRGGKEDERLFPALERGPDERYSHGFSKWFGRHKKRIGFDEPALVFHSFRHGFRDACRRAEINEETAQALGGWASESQAARYGDRGMVPVLDRAIRKLDFGSFTLPQAK